MYPITYALDQAAEGRNRLTTFFRPLIEIPWLIVVGIYGIGAMFAVIYAWFVLAFTGRYPRGAYDFIGSFIQANARINAFGFLATDEFPSFALGDDPNYPARVGIPEPLPEYSRMKVLLRLIVGIPVILLLYVQALIGYVMALFSWFAIVFTGKQSDGLFGPLRSSLAYQARGGAYFMLLTEDWPPFSYDDDGAASAAPAQPAEAPAAPPAA